MEVEAVNFSVSDLEMRTYRYLQQLAKSLGLPSNVKKVYLIQLIHAKKFKSEKEVNNIIQQVKSERQQLVQSRKKIRKRHLQNREITSTSKLCQSPPITLTPKRSVHPVLRYSPDYNYSATKCSSRHNYQPPSNLSLRSISGSDRVLRSFNLKALRKSYGAVNLNSTVTNGVMVQNQATSPKEKYVKIVSASGKLTKINLRCTERRHRPSILSGNSGLASRNDNPKQYIVTHNPQPQIARNQEISVPEPKRHRTLSGIYPLMPQEMPFQTCDQIQGLKLRRTDGRLSTINALVQKRSTNEYRPVLRQNNEVNLQEVLSSIDVNLNNLTHTQIQPQSSAFPAVTRTSNALATECKENDETDDLSVYYHKKIRSEQMGYRRMSFRDPVERLPTITDVFSRFNCIPNRSVTQPLYIQVTDASERMPSNVYLPGRASNTHMLESMYNFRASLLTNAPLLQIATTTNTKCVYTTPVIATAMVQQSVPLVASDPFTVPQYESDNPYRYGHDSEMYDLLRPTEQNGDFERFQNGGDFSNATSPVSQATIPEMVEDALEIISQDGDYMERIGMDIRVQCVLCSWAGPKIILEFHIRKEHESQIHKQLGSSEHSVVFTVGALSERRVWLSAALALQRTRADSGDGEGGALCVLSARYCEPDCIAATLCSLSSDLIDKFGSITIYNKVTGEPYTWEGPIQPLPPNLPYENDLPGLTVALSKLDLLPNSANLTLLNKELVLKSPTNVFVGQPELNNIQIAIFVRIS